MDAQLKDETLCDIIAEKRRLAKELRDTANGIFFNRGEFESKADDLEDEADRLDRARMKMEIEIANLRKENAKLRDALKELVANIEMRSFTFGSNVLVDTQTYLDAKVALATTQHLEAASLQDAPAMNTIQYGDIFIEVRQRVAAFQYWKEFTNQTGLYGISESDYLDESYRFLYSTASRKFIEFCAAKEGEPFEEYCKALDIDVSALL